MTNEYQRAKSVWQDVYFSLGWRDAALERFFLIGASSADAQPSAIKSRASRDDTSMISPVRRCDRSIPSMRSASLRVSRIQAISLRLYAASSIV